MEGREGGPRAGLGPVAVAALQGCSSASTSCGAVPCSAVQRRAASRRARVEEGRTGSRARGRRRSTEHRVVVAPASSSYSSSGRRLQHRALQGGGGEHADAATPVPVHRRPAQCGGGAGGSEAGRRGAGAQCGAVRSQ